MAVVPNKKHRSFSFSEKLEDCPKCKKPLDQDEYDFQLCSCGWHANPVLASLMRSCVDHIRANRAAKNEPVQARKGEGE